MSKSRFSHSCLQLLCRSLIIGALLMAGFSAAAASPKVEQGVVDLSQWDFDDRGAVALDGQWEFYWNQLYSPQQLRALNGSPSYFNVPATWDGATASGTTLSAEGVATYRLKIKLPAQQPQLAIKLLEMAAGLKVWVNGQAVLESGQVGRDAEHSTPAPTGVLLELEPGLTKLELVVQLSNFHYRDAGIWDHVRIGAAKQMHYDRLMQRLGDMFIIGGLLVIGIYNLALFYFRRQDKVTLFLSFLCVVMAVRVSITGLGGLLFLVWPDFPWELSKSLEFLGFYLGYPLLFSFIGGLYSYAYLRRGISLLWWLSLPFIVLVIFTPVRIFSQSVIIYQLIAIVFSLLLVKVLVDEFKHRRGEAWLQLAAVSLFSLPVYSDILSNLRLIESIPLAHIGLAGMVVVQSILVASRFSRDFSRAELAEGRVRDLNEHLEQKVIQRTGQLEVSNQQVERKNRIFSSLLAAGATMHQSRDLQTFLQDVIDKLTALFDRLDFAIIVEARRDGVIDHAAFSDISDAERDKLLARLPQIKQLGYQGPWHCMPMLEPDGHAVGYMLIRGTEYAAADLPIIQVFVEQVAAVTRLRQLTWQLEKMAHQDGLTGAFNRAYFDQKLLAETALLEQLPNLDFSVLVLDINGLKCVNDNYGHAAGDALIVAAYQLLEHCCRETDVICRLGGDEFAVICPATGLSEVLTLLERIRLREQGNQFEYVDVDAVTQRISLRVSMGMASTEQLAVEKLLAQADAIMYADKRSFYLENPRYR